MLGRLIKKYIEFQGLKQKVVAEKAGLEVTEYFAICRALGKSTEYFQKLLEEAIREEETA